MPSTTSSPNFINVARDFKEKSIESLSNAKDKVVEKTKYTAKRIDQEAHKKPWKFVGAAALVSAVVGFFVGRKSSK